MLLVLLLAFTLESSLAIALKRFDVLRVDPAGMERLPPSLRAIFIDPVPSAEPVDSLDEAVKRAGFDPRLPKSTNTPQFGVMDPVHAQITIGVADLNRALTDMKGADVAIPQNWDGVTIGIEQGRGILADYGDFFITQAPALTLSVPAGFPIDQFVEVLSRAVGMNAAEARTLSRLFAAEGPCVIPGRGHFQVHVGTGGLFGAFAHNHLIQSERITGCAMLDQKDLTRSSIKVEFPASAIRVVDPKESAKDRAEVQKTMETEVLRIAQFPAITFESTAIE